MQIRGVCSLEWDQKRKWGGREGGCNKRPLRKRRKTAQKREPQCLDDEQEEGKQRRRGGKTSQRGSELNIHLGHENASKEGGGHERNSAILEEFVTEIGLKSKGKRELLLRVGKKKALSKRVRKMEDFKHHM